MEKFKIKFETKEKELANQKLQLLNVQREKEIKNLIISSLATLLIIISLVLVYSRLTEKMKKKLKLELASESRKAKKVFSHHTKRMIDLWNQLSVAKNNHSSNQEKIRQLSEELFKTFDLCYPHFTDNLNNQYPEWKISNLQLKLCKLFALNWFDSSTIVSMNITTEGGLKQARLLIRKKLEVQSNLEIHDRLKTLLEKPD